MGASLYWYTEPKKEYLSCEVNERNVITERFGESVSESDIQRLQDLYAATKKQVYQDLIELVLKHETINLKLEY